jgi:hypothetical protein
MWGVKSSYRNSKATLKHKSYKSLMLYKLDQVPFWPFGIAVSFENAFFTTMLGIITVWKHPFWRYSLQLDHGAIGEGSRIGQQSKTKHSQLLFVSLEIISDSNWDKLWTQWCYISASKSAACNRSTLLICLHALTNL